MMVRGCTVRLTQVIADSIDDPVVNRLCHEQRRARQHDGPDPADVLLTHAIEFIAPREVIVDSSAELLGLLDDEHLEVALEPERDRRLRECRV